MISRVLAGEQSWHVEHATALEALATIPDASIDALVTDPPAGIEFMGKEWDTFRQGRLGAYAKQPGGAIGEHRGGDFSGRMSSVPNVGRQKANPKCQRCGRYQWDHEPRRCSCDLPEWEIDTIARSTFIAAMVPIFAECLRVLKPGAHGFVWALPRTSHWTATALEDAGFEVRDVVVHLFGSGFPKSLDVSKAIDKAAGAERTDGGRVRSVPTRSGGILGTGEGTQTRTIFDAPATEAARVWNGWGTALKPAAEHWILVRKPLAARNVAANVLEHGTGALNIDGCRVDAATAPVTSAGGRQRTELGYHGGPAADGSFATEAHPLGRWPANVTLDPEAAALLDEQSGEGNEQGMFGVRATGQVVGYGDTGGASRFFHVVKEASCESANGATSNTTPPSGDRGGQDFDGLRFRYIAKPDRAERNVGLGHLPKRPPAFGNNVGDGLGRGISATRQDEPRANHHPTVKPVELMQWLCRLITPPKGIVLDPFTGSGSTGMAALREGFRFVGIEREADYVAIARARITGDAPLFNTIEEPAL